MPTEMGAQSSSALPPSATNAVGHISYAQYDYDVGRVVNGEDANGVVTSVSYNDALDRPTQVIRAANNIELKNQTTFSYDDTARIVTTTSDQISYGDHRLKSASLSDGLGRVTERRQYESESAYIVMTQSYDAVGRVSQTSNPYRPGETLFLTSTEYDALGRVSKLKTPDLAEVNTAYSGNRVLVTDQAGKQRLSRTDALGRLREVWEIKSPDDQTVAVSFPGHEEVTAGYLTGYDYDALDGLTTVT